MGVTGNKGIDVRQTSNRLIFRVLEQDTASPSAIVTAGTTTLSIAELQDDGTLKTYDFSDNTFKAGAITTPTVNMTHQTINNGATNTGIWTYVLSTLTGFTKGAIYFAIVNNTGAVPAATPVEQVREWQFGSEQGDAATLGTDNKVLISTDAQVGVTIPTVTTLTNAPANSAGVVTILADYARRTGDYATAPQVDAQLTAAHGAGAWGTCSGTGAIDWSNSFVVTVSGVPRDGVYCRFTTDIAGLNTVAAGITNAFGKLATLMLDAGTYYVWLQLADVDFSPLPKTEVVS